MMLMTYRDGQQLSNEAQISKGGTDCVSYLIDFTDGVPSGVTITSVATVALDMTGTLQTANCVSTTTNSTAQTTVTTKTCGASGTAAAPDGSRFRLRTTATLTPTPGLLYYDVFIYVTNEEYLPL